MSPGIQYPPRSFLTILWRVSFTIQEKSGVAHRRQRLLYLEREGEKDVGEKG